MGVLKLFNKRRKVLQQPTNELAKQVRVALTHNMITWTALDAFSLVTTEELESSGNYRPEKTYGSNIKTVKREFVILEVK